MKEQKLKLYVDQFEKLNLVSDSKLEKTLWINYGANNTEIIKQDQIYFNNKRTGIVRG